MIDAARAGQKNLKGPWYNLSPLYEDFIRYLGKNRAAPDFEKWSNFIAATAGLSEYPSNLAHASYYRYLDAQGKPIRYPPAEGYGSVAQPAHVKGAQQIQNVGYMEPISHQKEVSMHENQMGNRRPGTFDTHWTRLLGMATQDPRWLETGNIAPKGQPEYRPRTEYNEGRLTMGEALDKPKVWVRAPNQNEYKALEDWHQGLANDIELPHADMQGYEWSGASKRTGLKSPADETALQMIMKRILYTADLVGESPELIKKLYIEGKIPLLGIGAAAGAAGVAADKSKSKDKSPIRGLIEKQ